MTAALLVCVLISCFSTGTQATSKPTSQGPEVRRVCVKDVDLHLGDRFEKVSERISVRPDPNGPNRNSDWAAGRETDFHSTKGPEYTLPDGAGVLRSTVFCTFDDKRRLTEFRLAWRFDGEPTAKARDAVLGALLRDIHTCLMTQLVEIEKDRYKARIDFGTYSQELVFEGVPAGPWHIMYTLSEEP